MTLAVAPSRARARTRTHARSGRHLPRLFSGVWVSYVVAVVGALVAVNMWFRPGTFVATGDMGPFIRSGWTAAPGWSWNHVITGAGSATYVMARWFEFGLVAAVHAVGGSDTLAQRLFYCTIYPMVAFGVAAFAAVFTRNRFAIAAAGLFGVFNGFFLTRLPNPLNVISVGSCALVAALLLRVAQGRRFPAPLLALCVLPMSFLAYNPPMLVVAMLWTGIGVPVLALLLFGRTAAWRVLKYMLLASPWVVLVNAFWLVPYAQSFTGGGGAAATANTDATQWAWAQAQNSVPNVLTLSANWAWFRPQYLPFTPQLDRPWWIWVRYLLPAAIFAAPAVVRPSKRRVAYVLLTLVLVMTVLAKGLQPPFTSLNLFLYRNAPGFWLFREPMSKLGQLLVLLYAALLALAIDGVARRLPRWEPATRLRVSTFGVAGLVLILAWPYPLITGAVIPDVRPQQPSAHVSVPSFWRRTAEMIDADPRPGKVLVLPLDDYYQMPTTWGFFGVDSIAGLLTTHPVLQRHPDGYFGDAPATAAQIDAVEQALLAGDIEAVQPLLRSLGVADVIVRHDLVDGLPGRTFASGAQLAAALDQVPDTTAVQRGDLDVYQVADGQAPTVRTSSDPLSVTAEPAGLAATVASDPGPTVVPTGAAPLTPTASTPRADGASSAPDGAYWPVGSSTGDAPVTTTFTATGGTYDVSQRARAAATLRPSEVADPSAPSGRGLALTDPASIWLDGQLVSQRPTTTYPLSRGGATVVTAGERSVSLDGWLTGGGSASTVPIGAATPMTAYALAEKQPRLSGYSPVYDCNNYEPRPQSELQLRADVTGSTVRLSAKDHAACTAVDAKGVTPGQTVRVRVEYRQVSGKRPQVCLLESGPDRCVLDRRLEASSEWTRYESVQTVSSDAEGFKVVLYANAGTRLGDGTVTEYRNVSVEVLDPILTTTAWPAAVPAGSVELGAGTHTLEVRGGARGTALSAFEPLEDCFRYDDQTMAEAGLDAQALTDEQGPAFQLSARDHMACLGATAPDYGAAALYQLQFEHRSLSDRPAKVCLYQRGPDQCQRIPATAAEKEWTTYRVGVTPMKGSVETRLYLYGLRDLTGTGTSTVEYRGIGLVPVATTSAVVVTRSVMTAPSTATADATTLDPTQMRVHLDAVTDGTVVSIPEAFAPGWTLTGLPDGATAEHVRDQGWANGWVLHGVSGAIDVNLRYAPAATARKAMIGSALAAPLAVLALFLTPLWRRRRARRRLGTPA